jgi:hypothetical protein
VLYNLIKCIYTCLKNLLINNFKIIYFFKIKNLINIYLCMHVHIYIYIYIYMHIYIYINNKTTLKNKFGFFF